MTCLSARFVFLPTNLPTEGLARGSGDGADRGVEASRPRLENRGWGSFFRIAKPRPPPTPHPPQSAGWDPQNPYTLFCTSKGQSVKPGYREDDAAEQRDI